MQIQDWTSDVTASPAYLWLTQIRLSEAVLCSPVPAWCSWLGGVLSNGLDKQVDSVQRRTTVARNVAVTGKALSVAASTLREQRERNAEQPMQDRQNLLFLRHQQSQPRHGPGLGLSLRRDDRTKGKGSIGGVADRMGGMGWDGMGWRWGMTDDRDEARRCFSFVSD